MTAAYQTYQEDDYRAFLFATHPVHGMLLLHCTRKKKKPHHFQAPGGHVDKEDFEDAVAISSDGIHNNGPDLLMVACKIGAARELFEETGIDITSALDRLQPVRLRENDGSSKKSLFCELKKRLFFKLCLEDGDFVTNGIESKVGLGLLQSMDAKPPPLMLKLSHEHQGFTFEPDATKAANLLVEHSGGKVSKALKMAIEQNYIIQINNEVAPADYAIETSEGSKVVGNPMEKEMGGESKKKLFGCLNCC